MLCYKGTFISLVEIVVLLLIFTFQLLTVLMIFRTISRRDVDVLGTARGDLLESEIAAQGLADDGESNTRPAEARNVRRQRQRLGLAADEKLSLNRRTRPRRG